MVVTSERARQTVEHLRRELAKCERSDASRSKAMRDYMTTLRIRRSLLEGLLSARATERPKKIVSLEHWRWGLAPRAEMLRYGSDGDDAATGAESHLHASAPEEE